MRLWDNAVLWRNLTFASAALALLAVGSALLLTVPLGARGPAPRPTVAVLVDAARQAVWLALANPAGTRLELRALQPISPPPGRVFALWLIDRPGAVPRALGPVPPGGRAIDQLPRAGDRRRRRSERTAGAIRHGGLNRRAAGARDLFQHAGRERTGRARPGQRQSLSQTS